MSNVFAKISGKPAASTFTTFGRKRSKALLMESANEAEANEVEAVEAPEQDEAMLESVQVGSMLNLHLSMDDDQQMLEAAEDHANQTARSDAMAGAIVWATETAGDAEDLDALVMGLAGVDGEGDFSDDDFALYEDAAQEVAEAFVALGADQSDVEAAISEASQDAASAIVEVVEASIDEAEKSTDEIITAFGVADKAMFEAKKMVVRGGKKKWVKKPLKKKRMNAKQKAALRKARKKAHTGAAKKNRAKSMRRRK